MKRNTTVIIGGGAAGLMAAGVAAQGGAEVLLLEKMAQTGRKIGISGKGRCNLTNSAELNDFIKHFGKNGRFLRQCLQQFSNHDLCNFFESEGLKLVEERGGRIFPQSGKALDVVKTLNNWLKRNRVKVRRSTAVTAIVHENSKITGLVVDGKTLSCSQVILATGGKSYPKTGSTGDGYRLAMSVGHTIVPLRPALVPLECTANFIPKLSGLDLRNIQVRLFIDGKRKDSLFGELSFTSTGLSGPVILSLSGQIVDSLREGKKVALALDLKPALDEKKLDARLIRDLEKRRGEPITSILRGLLPHQLVEPCINGAPLPTDIDTRMVTAKERKRIVHWLKNFRIDISAYRGWDEAIITAGGVNLKEVNPQTMESTIIQNLYIVGELLDLQADTGGYNLQAAFSTGWLAGMSACKNI